MAEKGKILTGDVTYISPVEIARVLEDLASEHVAIHAEFGENSGAQVFASRILWVEPDCSGFFVAYAADDTINSLVYKQAAIKFEADYMGERVSFFSHTPLDTTYSGKPAIYFPLPASLIHYQRKYKRVTVPAEAGLRCLVNHEKAEPLEMKVVDISEGGMGCIIYSETEPFAQGAVLKHCKLVQPDGTQLRIVLAVQYSIPTMLPNGTYVQRAGLRFVEPPGAITALVRGFSG
jgi:c-di-GMP-binding flagellar brake protein YcgR